MSLFITRGPAVFLAQVGLLTTASWSFIGCAPADPLDGPLGADDQAVVSEPDDDCEEDAAGEDAFASREITRDLAYPMRIVWGPDNFLWLTERTGKRVVRVNPADGART